MTIVKMPIAFMAILFWIGDVCASGFMEVGL
jgi:hypothetical protein